MGSARYSQHAGKYLRVAWYAFLMLVGIGLFAKGAFGLLLGLAFVVSGVFGMIDELTRRKRLERMMSEPSSSDGRAFIVDVPLKTYVLSVIPRTFTEARPYALVVLDDGSAFRYRVEGVSPESRERWTNGQPVNVWTRGSTRVARSIESGEVLWPVDSAKDVRVDQT